MANRSSDIRGVHAELVPDTNGDTPGASAVKDMPLVFNPQPDVPTEIEDAARSGELVVFVGAGIPRLIDCPSWDGFANAVLRQLVPKAIDHYELSQILSIADAKKRLSLAKILAQEKKITIDYVGVLQGSPVAPNVYTHLNRFNCTFVTTNYEKYLQPESRKTQPEDEWRFFGKNALLGANLDLNGNVLHLHGCVDDPENMVVTTRDYLDHYSSKEVQDFLRTLFDRKTVLFLGYGLEETEVLEYILRRGEVKAESTMRRFILQGFFNAERRLSDLLSAYYLDSFSTKLIGFPKDHEDFAQQISILEAWAKRLSFMPIALSDEAAALEDEING